MRKHGVSFEEARDVLNAPLTRSEDDPRHSEDEPRYFAVGESPKHRRLAVAYTIRGDTAWIISAREATPKEKRRYMNKTDILCDRPLDEDEDPLDKEIDFSNAKPIGKRFAKIVTSVMLDSDVCDYFRTSEEVNNGLRVLIREARVPHITYPP